MTKNIMALSGAGLFLLGAFLAIGAERLFFQVKDQRDAMETIGAMQDWRLSCPPRTAKSGACVLQSGIFQKGTSSVVAELTVAPKDKTKDDLLTIVTPLGVFIPGGVKVTVGKNVAKSVAFKTCVQMGCVATLPVDSALADSLTKNSGGQLTVMTPDGRSVPLNFSLRGYGDALKARAVDMAARS